MSWRFSCAYVCVGSWASRLRATKTICFVNPTCQTKFVLSPTRAVTRFARRTAREKSPVCDRRIVAHSSKMPNMSQVWGSRACHGPCTRAEEVTRAGVVAHQNEWLPETPSSALYVGATRILCAHTQYVRMCILNRCARGSKKRSPFSPFTRGGYLRHRFLVSYISYVCVCVLISYSVVDVVNRKKVKTPQTPLL